MEAIAATTLVAIAASMSAGVFASNAKISGKQYEINDGQNNALSKSEQSLSQSSVTSEGDSFEMVPAAGGSTGFSTLEDNGKIDARCQQLNDNNGSNVQYKVFKYDASVGSEPATAAPDAE